MPAAFEAQKDYASSVKAVESLGESPASLSAQRTYLKNLTDLIDECFGKIQILKKDLNEAEKAEEGYTQAAIFAEKVVPSMDLLRQVLDQIEDRVSDNHWPLPKYQEMLFTR